MRIIMHVDMDYFFAQVEERDNPSLKGKPLVVGANPKQGKGRGVVSTCNYEARAFGITSAMPISLAWKLCTTATFLPRTYQKYSAASREIMRILAAHADRFEQVGIDEAYLDISACTTYAHAENLGRRIKEEILTKTQLTCSIGIAPNKLLSKIAAGLHKPDGLTLVRPEDAECFLREKKIGVLFGVGPKTEKRLNALGITTCGDLANTPLPLSEQLGSFGHHLLALARGIDERELNTAWQTKSIGRQITFEKDHRNPRILLHTIDHLIPELYRQLCTENLLYKTITLKIRYHDFETHTKSQTLPIPTQNIKHLRIMATQHLPLFLNDPRNIRLIGIAIHSLRKKSLKATALATPYGR